MPDAPHEAVEAAARAAQAHEFIEELPLGYDTVVGERGITLSGGQRQRIAIARALLIDPRILILDDATASVDATTEARIRAGLREVMRGRTTIIIAHRLSTIALADEIVVLDHGRIAARGTQAELLEESPLFREIHEHGLLQQVRRRMSSAPGGTLRHALVSHPCRCQGYAGSGWWAGVPRRKVASVEGLAGGQPPLGRPRRSGRGLVVAKDAAPARRARPPRPSVPRPNGARRRHARRLHARRAPPAVSREARGRRRDLRRAISRRSRWSSSRSCSPGSRPSRSPGAQTYFTGWVGERGLADLRIQLFAHLQRLSLGYYERNRTGAIVSRITNDVEALDQLVTDGVSSLVQNTLLLVGTAVVLFLLDWRLALATLIVLPLMAAVTAWFRSRSNRAYRRVRERLGLVTATLAEDISGMRVVQSFTREPSSHATFRGVNERYRESNYETVVLNGIYFPTVDVLSSVATAIVLGFGGALVVDGSLTVGTLLAFTLYLANFFDPVQQLSQLYNTFLSATAALDRILAVLDEEPEVVDAPDAGELPEDSRARRLRPRALRVRRPPGRPPRLRPRRSRRARRSPSSATQAPGSRRSQSSSPASTTRGAGASRSTGTTSGT